MDYVYDIRLRTGRFKTSLIFFCVSGRGIWIHPLRCMEVRLSLKYGENHVRACGFAGSCRNVSVYRDGLPIVCSRPCAMESCTRWLERFSLASFSLIPGEGTVPHIPIRSFVSPRPRPSLTSRSPEFCIPDRRMDGVHSPYLTHVDHGCSDSLIYVL